MSKIDLPVTRYYGSKRKLVEKIWNEIEKEGLVFDTILDIFGGTGLFSYYGKAKGKKVTYNDIFKFNSIIGKKLIEQDANELSIDLAVQMLKPIEGRRYSNKIAKYFKNIYYTDEENDQIDFFVQNIEFLSNENIKSSAYYILFQSCIIKRPYNLFHRNNLDMRLNYTSGNFGNKKTWERSFEELFERFIKELDQFCFGNGRDNKSVNFSALSCGHNADLVYIDPPYFTKGSSTSYHSKYHFLEGLAHYDIMDNFINYSKKNHEVTINKSKEFESKTRFLGDLETLIRKHQTSHILISYRNNGVPSISEISDLLTKVNDNLEVRVIDLGTYQYALNKNNSTNGEVLIMGINLALQKA